MCFEILGLDIILNKECKPFLLEVNHTPSFTTDTPLDKKIKSELIRDTLILMAVNQKEKQKIIDEKQKQMNLRVLTRKIIKMNKEQRLNIIKECQLYRDNWENNNLGNFEKVYPTNDPEFNEPYDQFIEYARQIYEDYCGTFKRNSKAEISFQLNKKININEGKVFEKK